MHQEDATVTSKTLSVEGGYVHVRQFAQLPESMQQAVRSFLSAHHVREDFLPDGTTLIVPTTIQNGAGSIASTPHLGRLLSLPSRKRLAIVRSCSRTAARRYPVEMDFAAASRRANELADIIETRADAITAQLCRYEKSPRKRS